MTNYKNTDLKIEYSRKYKIQNTVSNYFILSSRIDIFFYNLTDFFISFVYYQNVNLVRNGVGSLYYIADNIIM